MSFSFSVMIWSIPLAVWSSANRFSSLTTSSPNCLMTGSSSGLRERGRREKRERESERSTHRRAREQGRKGEGEGGREREKYIQERN